MFGVSSLVTSSILFEINCLIKLNRCSMICQTAVSTFWTDIVRYTIVGGPGILGLCGILLGTMVQSL